MARPLPRVVIIGGGFGGLSAARALRRAPAEIALIDRRNHHLFQPLLYQVATAGLSATDIAYPIRAILRRQENARVLLGEVVAIDVAKREVHLRDDVCAYDYLVVATGATHAYFGHEEWAALAPGLKSLEDALSIRRKILLAFERAERAKDAEQRRALLTFVVVGGGADRRRARGRDCRDLPTGARARLPRDRSARGARAPRRGRSAGPAAVPG